MSLGSLLCITRQSLVMPIVTLGTDLSVRTSHSCQIRILWTLLVENVRGVSSQFTFS